jgi:predicted esterase
MIVVALLNACAGNGNGATEKAAEAYPWYTGRLHFKVVKGPKTVTYVPGPAPVFSNDSTDAWIYLPRSGADSSKLPLVVLLHGAGGTGSRIIQRLQGLAEETAMILVAPKSRGATWDVLRGYYGPDVESISSILDTVSSRYPIDRGRVFLAGFSDGASYALALGRINGDLFHKVAAFSPGILFRVTTHGRPEFFISHGTADSVLPIVAASRRFVPELRREGLRVDYREFEGAHTIPPDIARAAMHWLTTK